MQNSSDLCLNGSTRSELLREQVTKELDGVLSLPEARCVLMGRKGGEAIQVGIDYLWTRITVVCGPEYPHDPPRIVLVEPPASSLAREVKMNWMQGMGLREIVIEAISQAADMLYSSTGSSGSLCLSV